MFQKYLFVSILSLEILLKCFFNTFFLRDTHLLIIYFLGILSSGLGKSTKPSDVQKFTYLRSYLTNEALKSIRGLSITDENYGESLTILAN